MSRLSLLARGWVAGGAVLALFVVAAHAQQTIDAEIEQAIAAMRAAGQSEQQIADFVKAMDQVRAMSVPPPQATGRQANDIQAATGMTDEEMALVGPMANAIKARQDQQIGEMLQRDIDAFEKRYAHKPEIAVTFDGNDITMKRIDCQGGDAFNVSAQAAPTVHHQAGMMISAHRGWSVSQNKWLAMIGVQQGGNNYRADLPVSAISETRVHFDGVVTSSRGDSKRLVFTASCEPS
ncbi:MAG: hypothetical protein AAGC71_04535 [Pseudomonadota bacterium]